MYNQRIKDISACSSSNFKSFLLAVHFKSCQQTFTGLQWELRRSLPYHLLYHRDLCHNMSVHEADVTTQLCKQNATTQAQKDGLSEFPSLHLADTANKPYHCFALTNWSSMLWSNMHKKNRTLDPPHTHAHNPKNCSCLSSNALGALALCTLRVN